MMLPGVPDRHGHLEGLHLERGAKHGAARPVVRAREEAQLVVAQIGDVEVVVGVVVHRVAPVDLALLQVTVFVVQPNRHLEPITPRERLATRARAHGQGRARAQCVAVSGC